MKHSQIKILGQCLFLLRLNNFINRYDVKSGGLLYPISTVVADFSKYRSNTLLNEEGKSMSFVIDGIELKEEEINDDFEKMESVFTERILNSIN